MKAKGLIVFLTLLLTVPIMGGCGQKAANESSAPSQISSMNSFPDEALLKLQAALDTEPITIPADEWTFDTVCQATYFLGKNISAPCTLGDFGEGLELVENDEEYPISFNEDTHVASGFLTYYGTFIGGFVVTECNSKDDIFHAPIQLLNFSINEADSELISPISCNGVGLGDSKVAIEHELSFMDITTQDEEKGFYNLEKRFDDRGIFLTFSNNTVKSIRIRF